MNTHEEGALVRYRTTSSSVEETTSDPEESKTAIFGKFVELLQERYNKPDQMALSGAAHWVAFPVLSVIISGLWPVMKKIASTYASGISTQFDVDSTTKVIDRLVSGGIALSYASVADAADAFDHEVLSSIEGSSAEGPLVELGQRPSAQFFARLFKNAREHGELLQSLLGEIREENEVPGERSISYLSTDGKLVVVELVARYLDVVDGGGQPSAMAIASAESTARSLQRTLSALRKLKINPAIWPEMPHITLDLQWLKTQLLLASVDAPTDFDVFDQTAEHQSGVDAYLSAVDAVLRLSEGELFDRAMQRIQMRCKQPWSKAEKAAMEHLVLTALPEVKSLTPGVFDEYVTDFLIRVTPGAWLVGAQQAFNIAVGQGHSTHFGEMSISQQDEFLRTRVASAILWGELGYREFTRIVGAEVLPIDCIVDELTSLDGRVRRRAATHLIERKVLTTPEQYELVIEQGDVEITFELIRDHLEELPETVFDRAIGELWRSAESPEDIGTLIAILARVSDHQLRQVMDDLGRREELCGVIMESATSTAGTLSWSDFHQLRKRLGDRDFTLLILGTEVRQRRYDAFDDGGTVPAWDTLYASRNGYISGRVFGENLTADQLAEFPKLVSEEEAYRWAYAAEPVTLKAWPTYARKVRRGR